MSQDDPPPSYEGLIPKKKKNLEEKKKQFNSTGTVLANSTISSPNVADLLEACGEYVFKLFAKIDTEDELKKYQEVREKYKIFDETVHPITKISLDDDVIPRIDIVRRHFTAIFRIAELAPEALVMAMCFLRKLLVHGFLVYPALWRRAVLACLMVASKVWEELAVWLVDFVQVFPSLSVQDLSHMERHFLSYINFDVTLTAKEYAETYFELRAQSSSVEKVFASCKPLDRRGEEKLVLCTKKYHHHLERKLEPKANFQSLEIHKPASTLTQEHK